MRETSPWAGLRHCTQGDGLGLRRGRDEARLEVWKTPARPLMAGMMLFAAERIEMLSGSSRNWAVSTDGASPSEISVFGIQKPTEPVVSWKNRKTARWIGAGVATV